MQGCSVRALWVVNTSNNNVLFSRRFPTVDRRWQAACRRQDKADDGCEKGLTASFLQISLPTDMQIEKALTYRRSRESPSQVMGLRNKGSLEGSDSWVDDPITRHIISLQIFELEEDSSSSSLLWPLVLHLRGNFQIVVLPLVEPKHLRQYANICRRKTCGSPYESDHWLSSMLLELPCITGAFLVAKTIGDIIIGDMSEPEVFVSTVPTGGGLLDTLTVQMGITARAKPISVQAQAATSTTTSNPGAASSLSVSGGKTILKAADKEALRTFISSSMPFGIPLSLAASTTAAIRANGFSAQDGPPTDQTQPAWKPYLYRGKQRILFTVSEMVSAALYDRDNVPDSISIAGQVNCRAELEGLPDVTIPFSYPNSTKLESFTYHPCCQAQALEQGHEKQTVMFSPPLGNFTLLQYHVLQSRMKPPVQGFYQLSMVSENEGAFLFKLRLMDGYKPPFIMEQCTITIPSPRRKILSLDGTPSIGTILAFENSVEWKLVISQRALSKSTEVSFPGTIRFGQVKKTLNRSQSSFDGFNDEFDIESEAANDKSQSQDSLQEKMTKEDLNLAAVDLDEPFCWEAYSYAKVSFKLVGGSLSGVFLDAKNVGIYPAIKVPSEVSAQILSGDYILWNSLGRYPHVASR
ncbi:hypothetical protein KP509_37G011400 [Ceratopteris richardii]|uniref:MHD domain-containing protein n=1 Tax=Ceratopteris richardii TaxID=49495 RepID=A0A8T2Q6E5_CERRI|nr:hypothetical protein KP509_37G011400 [Ceratopteris richardii]